MLLVKAGVVKDPVEPVPPPPVEVHEVLLVDDQAITVVAPLAIEDGDAERETVGAAADATVTVVLWLADPPGPAHVTVYVVLVVNGGVVNEPVVPVPPPLGELQEMLSVDDQLRRVVTPLAIEEGTAIRVTVGLNTATPVAEFSVSVVVDPPPPPHEARPDTANSIAKITLRKALDPTV